VTSIDTLQYGDAEFAGPDSEREAWCAGVREERARVARALHDTLLQGVTGIALQLRAALRLLQRDPEEATELITAIATLAELTSQETRRAVSAMRAGTPDNGEVATAIVEASRGAARSDGVEIVAASGEQPFDMPAIVRDTVFRVGLEAVQNALKHAGAGRIEVRVACDAHRMRLVVRDDGRGFVVATDFRSYADHWGLLGMREQAERIGATLRIRSAPGCGTTVTMTAPLHAVRRGHRAA
jgi:signal transduction histidine kinase